VSAIDALPLAARDAQVQRKLRAGQSLFRQGDRTTGIYEVVSGKLRLARVDPSGREAILYSAVAGDIIGEASLFSPVYHCDAIASTKAVVRLYPKPVILAEFQRNQKAAQAFMAMLARQIMGLRTRLELRSIRSARDRVRHHLALNAGPDGRTVVLPGTVKELAGDLGLTHEALYRTLSEMENDGEIKRLKGKIRLATSI
jgi:CRP/FNR family transcriptional regulator, dissimilatory nitrate respiration regulator